MVARTRTAIPSIASQNKPPRKPAHTHAPIRYECAGIQPDVGDFAAYLIAQGAKAISQDDPREGEVLGPGIR